MIIYLIKVWLKLSVNSPAGLTSHIDREYSEDEKRSQSIVQKLKLLAQQKGQTYDEERMAEYQFVSRETCEASGRAVCQHSQFCGERGQQQCNQSVYLCISSTTLCDGHQDCLPGDISDELGCYLPYAMFTTGGVVVSLTLLGSSVCVYHHHRMMANNGMTSYKQDLVRRKDKVKARAAENKKNK